MLIGASSEMNISRMPAGRTGPLRRRALRIFSFPPECSPSLQVRREMLKFPRHIPESGLSAGWLYCCRRNRGQGVFMESTQQSTARRSGLPLILIAAVIQGWSLYALHRAIEAHQWPATHLNWLIALYAVAFLVPTTVQLTAEHADRASLWILTAILACAVFYFGWHHGGSVADTTTRHFALTGNYFPLIIVLLVWWLLTLPFLQSRVASGRWTVDYARLF